MSHNAQRVSDWTDICQNTFSSSKQPACPEEGCVTLHHLLLNKSVTAITAIYCWNYQISICFTSQNMGQISPQLSKILGNLVANVGCVIDFWELCCVSNLQILLKQVNWRFWDEYNSNLCNLPDALTLATAVLCMYKTRIATQINQ